MDTYANLKTEVVDWLNREGFATLVAKVDTFLGMAQRRIFRECDFRCLEDIAAGTTASLALPADFMRTKALYISNGGSSFEVTGGSFHNLLPLVGTGTPSKYAIVGTNMVMSPSPDQEYTYSLVYYKSLPLLSDANTTNWFTTNNPEILLFASLLEASIYLKDDARSQVWESRYKAVKVEQENSDARQDKEYGGMAVKVA